MPDMNIKAQHAVLVPYTYDGDILIDVVFYLNNRFSGLSQACGVGHGNVVADLLLQSNSRAGVVGRAYIQRINLDAAGAKEPLDTVTHRGIDGLAKNGVGSRVVFASCGLPRVVNVLATRAAKGQQRDDVGVGERRIRAIGHAHAFPPDGTPVKPDGHVIILYPR